MSDWQYFDASPPFTAYFAEPVEGLWYGKDEDVSHYVWKLRSNGPQTELLIADNEKAFHWVPIEEIRIRGALNMAAEFPPRPMGLQPLPASNGGRRRR